MNPLAINPLALLAGGAIVLSIGFGGGWTANGWRLQADISDAKATRSDEIATQSQAALKDLAETSKLIRAAAAGAQVDVSAVGAELEKLRKEFKDAKPAPLPVDCRPDAPRVRKLTGAADAVDKAIAR